MALFNHATKEVTAKLVYYGPGLCGKTTNLQWIHENLSFRSKGKLVSLATQTDRTLFFDFLPVELGTIRGMRTRMQIYTVPGQVFYESTRRMVLKGCDAVVFVADSQAAMLDANFESLQSLRRNLLANEIDPAIPMVLQYNKRDLPTALPVSVLNARLNPRNLAFFEAVAFKGPGVEETLRGITKALFKWLSDLYGGAGTGAGKASSEAIGASTAPAAPPPERVTIRVPQPTVKFKPPSDVPPGPAPAARAAAPPATPAAPPKPKATPATVPPRPGPPKAGPPATTRRPGPEATPATAPPPPATKATPATTPPGPARTPATPPAAQAPPVMPAAPAAPPAPRTVPGPVAAVSPPAPKTTTPPESTPTPRVEGPAETQVFVKPQAEGVPAAVEDFDLELLPEVIPEALPEEEPPATIRIRKQRVVISDVPADEPAAAPPPSPTPAAPGGNAAPAAEPRVFRESPPAEPADPPPQGEGLQAEQWLYLLDGAQRGPIDIEDLVDLVLTSIPEDTKVWHPGLDGWVRANKVREIAEEIPPPLPIPGAARGGIIEEEMPDFDTVPPQFRTALIADEDEGFRKYLAMPLAAQGFTILEAADGSAAWQLAVQHRPWLILADVSMPEVDGFEFCRRVRSHPLLSHTPLLFISGSDKYKERYRALQIGADDFLSKQMPIRELLMRIQLLLTKYSDLSDQTQEAKREGEKEGAFEGRIEVFGAPALLQMCAQGRLSGLFTALAEDEDSTAATMGFRGGEIISASVGPLSGVDAAYSFLTWEKGSFQFTPGDPGGGEPLAQSVEHLLLEGCRLLDESARDAGSISL